MENMFTVIAIVILIMIMFLIFIDVRLLKKVGKSYVKDEFKLSDERYYELKNRIQLLTVASSIIVVVGGYLGYSSIASIKMDVSSDVDVYKQRLIDYDSTMQAYDSTFEVYAKTMEQLEADRQNLLTSVRNSNEEVKRVFIELLNEYRLSYKSYIISGIKIREEKASDPPQTNPKPERVYFNDLATTDNLPLPIFTEPPFIAVTGKGVGFILIESVTKDYFEYGTLRLQSVNSKVYDRFDSFDLLIIVGK